MKSCTTIIIIFVVSAALCDDGGVKVIINQRLIDSLLSFFYKELTSKLESIPIDDKGIFSSMEWGIRDLTRDKISLQFENNGIIHATASGFTPFFKGKAKFLGKKSFEVTGKNVKLDVKVKINSQKLPNGRYAPKIEIPSDPKLNIKLDGKIKGGVVGWILNKLAKLVTKVINFLSPMLIRMFASLLKNKINRLEILLPTETSIDYSKGLYLDFALASPINLKAGFLELNSIAHLYNKNIYDTRNSNRYPLSYLPSFSFAQNQLQLYVSEYFLNSAIYTLLKTNKKTISLKSKTNVIETLLPGLVNVYGNKDVILTITNIENSYVKLIQNNLNVNAVGTFTISVDGINEPVYKCEIELSLLSKLLIRYGPKLSGEINQISAKVKKILLNKNPKVTYPLVGNALSLVDSLFRPIINGLIKQDFELQFPKVMGIEFKDVSLEIKDQYFIVNYNFNQINP